MSSIDRKLLMGAPITAAPTPTVTPQGPGGATTWTYQLVAKDRAGNPTAGGATGTTAVGIAFALAGDASFNRVTWTDVANAVADGVTYDVYRTAPGSTVWLANVAAGAQLYDDHGYNGRPVTALPGGAVPLANTTGRSEPMPCTGLLSKTIQITDQGGAAFVGDLQLEGSLDGRVWEAIGGLNTAAGYLKTDRAYGQIRGRWVAYTSGAPAIYVSAARVG
jgi:hypothetical protein